MVRGCAGSPPRFGSILRELCTILGCGGCKRLRGASTAREGMLFGLGRSLGMGRKLSKWSEGLEPSMRRALLLGWCSVGGSVGNGRARGGQGAGRDVIFGLGRVLG